MTASKAVFIDTSGWIALLNADEGPHAEAIALFQEFAKKRRRLVTTDWIFAETGNGLARTAARGKLAQTIQTFLQSKNCRLVRVDKPLFLRALAMYDQFADKTWGLVDCASFVAMREHGIEEAVTRDRHFTQAGFRALLPTQ